ncbi:C2 and GRAM domain-containing protein, partial [Cucurbita argyrosperma subsp. argyrosperma]
MKITVRVIEARNLPATDLNGSSDPYVRLQLGRQRFRTKVVKKTLNPSWGEEFSFRVDDLDDELTISILDEDRYFNDDFVGQVKIPMSRAFDFDNGSLGATWHSVHPKTKKSKQKDCGEILLAICFSQTNAFVDFNINGHVSYPKTSSDEIMGSPLSSHSGKSSSPSPVRQTENSVKEHRSSQQKTFAGRIAQMFHKNVDSGSSVPSRATELSEISAIVPSEISEASLEDQSSSTTFDEGIRVMESKDQETETPSNLPGIMVDQLYAISPSDLNSLLFSSDSSFLQSLADLQGTTELQLQNWKFENGGEMLKRSVSYLKAPTKLIKAVKAFEEQTYLKADGKVYAVLAIVSTPDVMYGSTFKVEILYCITPGPELPSEEKSSRLVISWRMNFLQSTMMKGMIENGARQGIKDNFDQYSSLLSQTVRPVDQKNIGSNKEQVLASLQAQPQSTFKLAVQYFANCSVVVTTFMALYVLVHIFLAAPSTIQGLEFVGLDLPDSIGEFIVCGVLVLQGERVLGQISRFMQARLQKGSDHGVKAQGDGWLLTVALIEGCSLAAVNSSGLSDPYVVFTCNGKTKSSSIKFQKSDPQWNEIFEFDAMNEPPSVLGVEVYDFDGPFDEAASLGYAEINFLRTSISDLADIWVPLQGKLAQTCQSKLHLRIFLDNTRGSNVNVVKEYLSKMEKEVGKKISLRSPQSNSTFQKLFGLPAEEFLINDFTCHLKRKMPIQGRIFLSARVIGFHANIFGHKTKFFFLWEDIEDIQVVAPTLSSMGSPIIVITLRAGRGLDARSGAKTLDEEGRLKFHFHSFVSFGVAHRTILALWRAKSLSPEQKVQIVEEESEAKGCSETEENGSCLGPGEISMSEVLSSILSVSTNFAMELFNGAELERKVMEKAGCLNYSFTPWESEKENVYERQIYYIFDKRISHYRVEVTSAQQRHSLSNRNGWLVEEVLTLHGVPLGDYFNVHLRYQIEDLPSKLKGCSILVSFGMAWQKRTKHQKRITKNILKNLQDRLKVTFGLIENESATR